MESPSSPTNADDAPEVPTSLPYSPPEFRQDDSGSGGLSFDDEDKDNYFHNVSDTDEVQVQSIESIEQHKAARQRQSDEYANAALHHYNNQEKIQVKIGIYCSVGFVQSLHKLTANNSIGPGPHTN